MFVCKGECGGLQSCFVIWFNRAVASRLSGAQCITNGNSDLLVREFRGECFCE